jgi:serine protease Do
MSLLYRSAILVAFCFLAFGAAAQTPAQTPEQAAESLPALKASVDHAVSVVNPALVRIRVVSTEYSDGREMKYQSTGSGAIISREGHIITNHHVAGHATRLFCTMSDREEIEADLVGADAMTDIAVIKLKAPGREFPVAAFGDSTKVRVGDTVLAMGCPMALSQSVTLGIVSNTEVVLPQWSGPGGKLKEDGEDVGSLVKWIGHDAEIAPGNSGGPLVNLAGEIVGINEIWMGLGGAIPGNLAKDVADQLVANGKVTRAWLGIVLQPRLKYAKETRGALVSAVVGGSPADTAGIKAGDLLLSLAGTPVGVQYSEELPDFNRFAAALPIGQETDAVVLRDGAEVPLKVTPEQREEVQPKEQELKEWGITASNLSMIMAKEMKRPNRDGVIVTSVRTGGAAGEAKPSVNPRDVIVEVGGTPIANMQDLAAATAKITEGKTEPTPVLTTFERRTERYVAVVKVGVKDLLDPGLEVKKAWLPIETQVVTREIAQQLGRPEMTGFRVTQVYSGTAAEAAGLKTGDYVLAVDDEPLTASAPEHNEELSALIRQYKVGDTVNLKVLRGAEELVVPVELVRSPMLEREMKEYRNNDFELTVRDISFFSRAKEQWKEDRQGVVVSEVKPGGWAALGKVGVGDLILAVDGADVVDIASFSAKMGEIAVQKPNSVVFKILRGIYTFYVELEPKWESGQ